MPGMDAAIGATTGGGGGDGGGGGAAIIRRDGAAIRYRLLAVTPILSLATPIRQCTGDSEGGTGLGAMIRGGGGPAETSRAVEAANAVNERSDIKHLPYRRGTEPIGSGKGIVTRALLSAS